MRTRLPADPHAPAAARRYVQTGLARLLGADTLPATDDVVLVVSELVTNSVRASASTVALSLEVRRDRVEVEVTDDAGGWPTRRDVDWDQPNGRGLAIVDKLADRWHATERGTGKSVTVVWFRGHRTR
jgi:anti-sigma regulatory factor (Ser/Thr protein kinase)